MEHLVWMESSEYKQIEKNTWRAGCPESGFTCGSNKELQADIADFVQKFASKVFSEGGSIVHGSHPSIH